MLITKLACAVWDWAQMALSQPMYRCIPASVTITAVDLQTCGCSYECITVQGSEHVSVQLCTICMKPCNTCNNWYVQALRSALQCCPVCVRGDSDMSHCNKAFKSCPVYDPVSVAMIVCVAQCIFLSCWHAEDVVQWRHTIQSFGPVFQCYKRAAMGFSMKRHFISRAAQP